MRDIAANPMVALRNLADPNKYRGLDPVARQRLASSATSAMQAQATAAEAAERRAERAQRRLADQAANDLYARIALAEQGRGPMPTVADVQAQREWLSPGETAALLARIRAATHRDDPGVRLDLERDVDRVDPVAFDARVRRAVDGGQLTAEMAANLLRANRAARRDDAPPWRTSVEGVAFAVQQCRDGWWRLAVTCRSTRSGHNQTPLAAQRTKRLYSVLRGP